MERPKLGSEISPMLQRPSSEFMARNCLRPAVARGSNGSRARHLTLQLSENSDDAIAAPQQALWDALRVVAEPGAPRSLRAAIRRACGRRGQRREHHGRRFPAHAAAAVITARRRWTRSGPADPAPRRGAPAAGRRTRR